MSQFFTTFSKVGAVCLGAIGVTGYAGNYLEKTNFMKEIQLQGLPFTKEEIEHKNKIREDELLKGKENFRKVFTETMERVSSEMDHRFKSEREKLGIQNVHAPEHSARLDFEKMEKARVLRETARVFKRMHREYSAESNLVPDKSDKKERE